MANSEELRLIFTEDERLLLTEARALPAKQRSSAMTNLLRRYWRAARARARAGYTRLKDGRINADYHDWLAEQGLEEKFSKTTWDAFRKACRHGVDRGC